MNPGRLTPRQLDALRAAPIGVQDLGGEGGPPRYRYDGVNGRTAGALLERGLVQLQTVRAKPRARARLMLIRTAAGDLALLRHPVQLALPFAGEAPIAVIPAARPLLSHPWERRTGPLLHLEPAVDGCLVRFSRPRFQLLLQLRSAFPRSYAAAESWTWIIPGSRAWPEAEHWLAGVEVEEEAASRRQAWMLADHEWEAAAGPTPDVRGAA